MSAEVGASISCIPGPPFGLVADHDHVARFDLLRHDRLHARGLRVKHARGPVIDGF